MSCRFRACSIVTRAQPPVAVVAVFSVRRVSFLRILVSRAKSAVVADGDGDVVLAAESPLVRVVGEDAAHGAQAVDQIRGLRRGGHLRNVLPAAGRCLAGPAQEDGDGRQVGEDLVPADVGVLRPAGAGSGGAGVAVAAPVGGPAVGPG